MKPEVLAKIETRWPHLATMCANYRTTGDVRIRNGIVHAVLSCDVGYLTPSEILYLAALRAGGSTSQRKADAARENGKLGGRPKSKKRPPAKKRRMPNAKLRDAGESGVEQH